MRLALKILCLSICAGLWLCGPLRGQSVQIATDATQHFQTIDGFGTCLNGQDGSGSPYANSNFATPIYSEFAHDYAQDLGASMVRINLHPDASPAMPQGGFTGNLQTDIGLLNFQGINVRVFGNAVAAFDQQKIDQMRVVASIWSPPGWMKGNNNIAPYPQPDGSVNDPNNHLKFDPNNPDQLDPATLTQFARYVAAYVAGYQQVFHVPIYGISLQNELMFNTSYISCSYWQHYANQPTDPQFLRYAAAVKAVGEEFQKDGITTKIIGPESMGPDGPITSNDAIGYFTHAQYNYITAVNSDTQRDQYGKVASDYLGAYAIHSFGEIYPATDRNMWSYYSNLIGTAKPSWDTETKGESTDWYVSGKDANGNPYQDGALMLARHIHEALAYGNVSALIYWQAADGAPQSVWNLMSSDAQSIQNPERSDVPNYKYDVMRHYSYFVRPGAVRIAASPTDSSGNPIAEDPNGINVDAYMDAATHKFTVELINLGASAQQTNVAVPQTLRVSTLQAYLSANGIPWEQLPDLSVTGASASVLLPAESILTLDGIFRFAADLNNDGSVGFDDLVVLAKHYGATNATYEMGDINGDGKIDFSDLVLLARSYGAGPTAAQIAELPAGVQADVDAAFAQVPEPASGLLFGAAALAVMIRRRR